MPRQKKEKKETLTAHLPRTRCRQKEREAIEAKAVKAGLSLSEYQRRACLESAVIVRDNSLEVKAVSQLSAIGNNLNQLVRKTHIHDEADTRKMRDILEAIDSIIMGIIRGS